MVRTLDSRSSQNMSYPIIPDQFYSSVPVLIAQVGLQINDPGDLIRVNYSGVFGIFIDQISLSNIVLRTYVVRGTTMDSGLIVFMMDNVVSLNNIALTRAFSFTGSDYDVPPPDNGLLIYSCFIYSSLSNLVLRRGPESFNATAYCDD